MAEQGAKISVEDHNSLAAAKVRVQQELLLVNQLAEAVLANPSGKIPPGQQPFIPVCVNDIEEASLELIQYLKNYVRIATRVNAEKIP